MELNIKDDARCLSEGLGITLERRDIICSALRIYLKPLVREHKDIHQLEALKDVATMCVNVEECIWIALAFHDVVKCVLEEVKEEERAELLKKNSFQVSPHITIIMM